jgi:hypothetical protein
MNWHVRTPHSLAEKDKASDDGVKYLLENAYSEFSKKRNDFF